MPAIKLRGIPGADFLAHEGIEHTSIRSTESSITKSSSLTGATVLTGSFNLTKAAEENNAENLLVDPGCRYCSKYEQNWQTHFNRSEYYAGR